MSSKACKPEVLHDYRAVNESHDCRGLGHAMGARDARGIHGYTCPQEAWPRGSGHTPLTCLPSYACRQESQMATMKDPTLLLPWPVPHTPQPHVLTLLPALMPSALPCPHSGHLLTLFSCQHLRRSASDSTPFPPPWPARGCCTPPASCSCSGSLCPQCP